jgi:hypothetical protein
MKTTPFYSDIDYQFPNMSPDSPFMFGCMDHTPNEHIEHDKVLTSVFLFYSPKFHSEFESVLTRSKIHLNKWSSSKKYKDNFKNTIRSINSANLPFFVHVLTAYGSDIYKSKQHYIDELLLNKLITTTEQDNAIYDEYNFVSETIKTNEKTSLGALHIAHFILRSYHLFKEYCATKNIPFLGNPFELLHDRFASNRDDVTHKLVQLCVNMTLYHGYPTREISLKTPIEPDPPENLFVDNLCGYFHSIKDLDSEKPKGVIFPNNLVWERWES